MSRASPFTFVLAASVIFAAGFVAILRAQPARELARREDAWHVHIQPGDVVFQDLECGLRCDLIRDVTKSRYTHTGIVLDEHGERMVWEAFEPVGPVSLAEWLQRGKRGNVAVYRLDAPLLAKLPQIADAVRAMKGLPYDGDYQWDDARIYCSELIEKAVERGAGTQLFAPHPLGAGAFGSHTDGVRRLSQGRLTEQTPLVSPLDLTRSPHLTKVVDELEGAP